MGVTILAMWSTVCLSVVISLLAVPADAEDVPLAGVPLADVPLAGVPLCQFTVEAFVSTLESDSSLDDQSAALLPVCSQLTDPDAKSHCQRNVQSYWAYLAPELYNANIATEAVFEWVCSLDYGTEDQCEECKARVLDIGTLFTDENVMDSMTTMVQGDLFCDMDNAWWDVPACQEEWAWFMPEAGLVLSEFVWDEKWTLDFCTGPVGVCHATA